MAIPHTPISFKGSDRAANPQVWESLKRAIAGSSGFKRWQIEHAGDEQFQSLSLDVLVHSYLRETLETLAY